MHPRDIYWHGKRVFVTGGTGFLGHHVLALLGYTGAEVWAPTRQELDLECPHAAGKIAEYVPDIVIHLAAHFGGVHYVSIRPDAVARVNETINDTVFRAVAKRKPKQVLVVSSACAYGEGADQPLMERDFFLGEPHPSVRAFAYTKRRLARWAQDHEAVCPILTTLYGPDDHLDDPTRAHFLGGLLGRMARAKEESNPEFSFWGTGAPIRDVLYVKDAADALLFLLEHREHGLYNVTGLGGGHSIAAYAEYVAHALSYPGKIVPDITKLDGALRKELDGSALAALGWRPRYSFEQGLRETVAWMVERNRS